MSDIESILTTTIGTETQPGPADQAELAAAAFRSPYAWNVTPDPKPL